VYRHLLECGDRDFGLVLVLVGDVDLDIGTKFNVSMFNVRLRLKSRHEDTAQPDRLTLRFEHPGLLRIEILNKWFDFLVDESAVYPKKSS